MTLSLTSPLLPSIPTASLDGQCHNKYPHFHAGDLLHHRLRRCPGNRLRTLTLAATIEETDEYNNTAVYAVTIGTGPDLTASANVANSYTPSQTGIQIPVTVSRAGANLPSTGYVHAKLYWSTNSTWDTGDQVLWSSNDSIPDFPTSTLNSNGSWTVNATINIPTSTPGTYYIIAYADAPQASYPSGYHEETNENNNTAVYAVTIIQATTPSTARFVPLHRAYSSNDSDHFYTTDPAQATPAYLQARGYTYEKIEAYISDRSFQGGVSLYRLYHSSGKSHYYTTNETGYRTIP